MPGIEIADSEIKRRKLSPGNGNNRSLAQQELLTDVRLVLWLDSSEEDHGNPCLEQRATQALTNPGQIDRFGGLSFGESSHLVDEVKRFDGDPEGKGAIFLLEEHGRLTLPVWVDHVGSAGTRFETGDLCSLPLLAPDVKRTPKITPY